MSTDDDHPRLAYLVGASNLSPPHIRAIRGDIHVKVEMTEDMLWDMAIECLQALLRIRRDQKRKTTVVQE